MMIRRHLLAAGVAATIGLAAAPAAAQFSDSYNFLNAVRQSDGTKATKALEGNGATLVNTRDYSTGETALMITIKRRDLTWSSFLLGKGANPNVRDAQGNAPLHAAALLGFTEGAELLLGRRAQVNMANNSGETPLIIAVQQRNVPMVRLLLMNGADPKIADRIAGKSARDYASEDPRGSAVLKVIDETKSTVAPKKNIAGPGL
ncbi:ankyrin repeat domain-containing protein [Sphingomonas histidinilytica]|jgi:ankyrin repeat protein|uniref:Ankyrin repeat-containing protein n=1 Tax=Rhizorhabdus histidinilytica TaxID=439228 RepID=A0A1T5DNW1_9SPHN|nr:ankyrin repeat domain-containing protein [Rhizorhabdus histidinilytica]MBO9379280.1 ankyrin repeat domain-containing protein [Rhizorhabdus histidinilytica]QEH80435.1 ankyrin repeat domain-containing protein [Sphingomonas sp. C8-2]SKB73402.1 Ankyrin repeat-containing protein [Rhizorhabdus histidinilytica]